MADNRFAETCSTPEGEKDMAEMTAEQIAQQVAQSVGETVRQASAETTRAVIDSSRTAGSQEVGAEREMETGTDEAFKSFNVGRAADAAENQRVIFANLKATYDAYQQESLESIKRNRTFVDKVLLDAQQYDNQRQALANLALQNAIETANMVGKNATVNLDALQKQHTAHRDIATDAAWNPVQQGAGDTLTARAVSIDDASLKAIGAAMAAALAESINPKK